MSREHFRLCSSGWFAPLVGLCFFAPTTLAHGDESPAVSAAGSDASDAAAAPATPTVGEPSADIPPPNAPPTPRAETVSTSTPSPPPPPRPEPSYLGSDILFWTTVSFAAVHIADHVVRNNHSGFPYTDEVTPATIPLNIIPFIYAAGLYFDGPLSMIIADSLLLAAIIPVHIFIEPPTHLLVPWENGSNLLEVESAAAGGAALAVLGGLLVLQTAHLGTSIYDGLEYGFTWRRSEPGEQSEPAQ